MRRASKKYKFLIYLGIAFFIISTHLLSEEMSIPPWLDVKLGIKGELEIGKVNQLKVLLKSRLTELCVKVEPFSLVSQIEFINLSRENYVIEKGKSYLLVFPFKIKGEVKDGQMGVKIETEYPVDAIKEEILRVYPEDSWRRDELLAQIEAKRGETAEFREYLTLYVSSEYSYTSLSGMCPFKVIKLEEKVPFFYPSDEVNMPVGEIEKKIKDLILYIEMLKDPAVGKMLTDDLFREKRQKLEEIFTWKFKKILLLSGQKREKEALRELDKFLEDLMMFRIAEKSLWADSLALYLYLKLKNKDFKLLPVVEKFLSKKVKSWELSFIYYDYSLFWEFQGKKEKAADYRKLARESNPYLHIAK